MKSYKNIPGPNTKHSKPKGDCIVFDKLDGSQIRAEWSAAKGWYKFGSKNVLLDKGHPDLGDAIDLFIEKYGKSIPEAIQTRKGENITAFCEFFGPNSFAGRHFAEEPKDVVLFDIGIHKKGMLSPWDFRDTFGHLDIPKIHYEGSFSTDMFRTIMENEQGVFDEGAVIKGLYPQKKAPHGLWVVKVKTFQWLEKLKKMAEDTPGFFSQIYADNVKEQTI